MYHKIYVYFIPTFLILTSVGCINEDLNANYGGIGRYKRQQLCGDVQFQCTSGRCINEDLLCDGKADCSDNSDETSEECGAMRCPTKFFFRCDYGACVNRSVQCNGVKDCYDGSDERQCPGAVSTETPTVNAPTSPPPSENSTIPAGSCLVPHLTHGHYKLDSADVTPGDYVPTLSVLMLSCDRNFRPSPPTQGFILCINGTWSKTSPSCARLCSSVRSSVTTKVTCQFRGQVLDNCDDPIDGTVAKSQCELFHEGLGLSRNFHVCKDGIWDYPFSQCTPVCGVKRPLGVTNIPVRIKQSTSPWHVGVYRTDDKQQICGGSIISERVVLSAAHCFTGHMGRLYPTANFQIAAGKYYRSYNDPRDTDAQYSLVDRVHVPERYRGIVNNYEADLAVVVLSTSLRLSAGVQSVCVDWDNNFEYKQLVPENLGEVVGWGYSSLGDGRPTEEVNEIQVAYKPYDECIMQVPTAYLKFLTHDKICAGHLLENQSICQVGTGGGLTFQSNQGLHYIRGIASTAPTTTPDGTRTCDSTQYGTYILISKYINFIKQILEQA